MTTKFMVLTGLLCISSAAYLHAEQPPLKNGMTASEVRAKWGTPLEMDEREISRIRVWRYKDGRKVTFSEGKLSSWREANDPESAHRVAPQAVETPAGIGPAVETLDIVREIAREVPSAPDSPSLSNNATDPIPSSQPQGLQPLQVQPLQQGYGVGGGGFHGGILQEQLDDD